MNHNQDDVIVSLESCKVDRQNICFTSAKKMPQSKRKTSRTITGRIAASHSSPSVKHVPNHSEDHTNHNDGNGNGNASHSDNNDDNNNDSNNEALGSGLATFFGDFFPSQKDVNGRPIGFSTNLSLLPTNTETQDANDLTDSMVGVKYIHGGLTHEQGIASQNNYVANYVKRRLCPLSLQHDEESSSESSFEDGGDVGETMEPESQPVMETQEPVDLFSPSRGDVTSAKKRTRKRRRRPIVPSIEDCLHDVTKLKYMDLYTRTLTLNLSRIDGIWKLRDTNRCGAFANSNIAKPAFELFGTTSGTRRPSDQLPRKFAFEYGEEDGPLATIYQKVFHLELEQLQIDPSIGVGGVIGGPNEMNQPRQQRIKVFFYNSYATTVSEWIKAQQQKEKAKQKVNHTEVLNTNGTSVPSTTTSTTSASTGIAMSLSNVPAICIFPRNTDPRNWRERQEVIDYCLCIGDRSTGPNQIRFDSNEMEIRLMPVIGELATTRTTTAAGCTITNDAREYLNASSELVLSRRALTKEFLSSDDGTTDSRERVAQEATTTGEITNPLQESWAVYTNHRSIRTCTNKTNNGLDVPQPGTTLTAPENIEAGIASQHFSSRSENDPNEPSLGERNQRQEVPPRSHSPRHNRNGNSEGEPMIFKGIAQRISDSPHVCYPPLVRLVSTF